MYKQLAVATALLAATAAQAVVITQWNFNSTPGDNSTATGNLTPNIGAGTASLVGGTTGTFATGAGSTDPAATDDSGRQTTAYAAQGADDKTRGAQFTVDTTGFNNVVLSWDQRFSNTSSKHGVVQYTVNGVNYLDTPTSSLYLTAAGDTWLNNLSYDFSAVAGASDNPLFGLRMVSTFRPSTSAYDPANPVSTYGSAGTWRFDMVTINGTAIPPIPEPGIYALLLAGLGVVGFVARRRG